MRAKKPVIYGTLIFFAILEESTNQLIRVGKSGARAAASFRERLKKWQFSAIFSLVAFFKELNKFANCENRGVARSPRG
ncbi:MAG: hypothetical protein ACYC1L_12470 [Alphaproteobacteria bacterium]